MKRTAKWRLDSHHGDKSGEDFNGFENVNRVGGIRIVFAFDERWRKKIFPSKKKKNVL